MPVIYNGYKIIPAPFISIIKQNNQTEDGRKIQPTFGISVKGKFLPDKGSPTSSGTFWTNTGYPPDETVATDSWLTSILRKQEALRDLFSVDGKAFEVQGYDGAPPFKCNPRVKSIKVPQGDRVSWAHLADYEIELEYEDADAQETNYYITKADETWNIEPVDENNISYRLTHSVNAQGRRYYDANGNLVKQGWETAKDYVLNQIGLGLDETRITATGVLNFSSMQAYNYGRTQQVNEYNGQFAVTETWICYDPKGSAYPSIEEFDVDITSGIQDGLVSVKVKGQIKGLEVRNNTTRVLNSTKYANASGYYQNISGSLFQRAQNMSGFTLNALPMSKTVTRNELTGTINYAYEYNNRPTPITAGALSESISVTADRATDIFAEIPIIGRALGPIIQDMDTVSSKKKSVNIEVVMPATSQTYSFSAPNVDAIVELYTPTGVTGTVKKERDTETYSVTTGRYSRQVSWIYQ